MYKRKVLPVGSIFYAIEVKDAESFWKIPIK